MIGVQAVIGVLVEVEIECEALSVSVECLYGIGFEPNQQTAVPQASQALQTTLSGYERRRPWGQIGALVDQ